MTVTAPSQDKYGAALDAQIAQAQALVNANKNPTTLFQIQQLLNQLQVQAVDYYMVTGWLNAATILATYSAPTWDAVGKTLTARVAFLQNLVNNPPVMPPGNASGFGGSGWTNIGTGDYAQKLYAAQIALVEHIMDLPGGTPAATILANLTGSQTNPAGIAYQYKFSSVGFTDEWLEGG